MTFNPAIFIVIVLIAGGLYWAYSHGKLSGAITKLQAHLDATKPVVDAHVALVTAVAASQNPAPVGNVITSVLQPAPVPLIQIPPAPSVPVPSVPVPSVVIPGVVVAAPPIAAVTPAPDAPVWPQYVKNNTGVVYQVYAPLNPAYAGGMTDFVFGQPPHFLFEPSNGVKFGQPLRSPNGYPLLYPNDGAKVTGPALVLYGGQTFKDDAAVAAYLTAGAASNAASSSVMSWNDLYKNRAKPSSDAAASVSTSAPVIAQG